MTRGSRVVFFRSTTATQYSNVGTYAITVTLGLNPNYDVTFTNGTLTKIGRASRRKANEKTKNYGQANTTLTATVTGEVTGGDTVNYTLATAANTYSKLGTYAM